MSGSQSLPLAAFPAFQQGQSQRPLFANAPVTQAPPVLNAPMPQSSLAGAMMGNQPMPQMQTPNMNIPLGSIMAAQQQNGGQPLQGASYANQGQQPQPSAAQFMSAPSQTLDPSLLFQLKAATGNLYGLGGNG